ncbi:MAG: DUF5686 and carboxypeptidase regulatory-like domain-containing protein [Bacteroidota bacterium]
MCFGSVYAQQFRLSGRVVDTRGEGLPLATVEIKQLQQGRLAKDDGSFEFQLERGKYDLVVSLIGYKSRLVPVFIHDQPVHEVIQLTLDESSNLGEVVVRVKSRDRAEELVRQLIRDKESKGLPLVNFSQQVYIRAQETDSSQIQRTKSDSTIVPDPFKGVSLTEVFLKVDQGEGSNIKEERVGVKQQGRKAGLFYLTTTDGRFNLYENLIQAPALSQIPFVSPISNSGLLAYRFKTVKIDRTQRPRVYTISVRPRALSNATIEGEIVVRDSTWELISAQFELPKAHTPEYDRFEVRQEYRRLGDTLPVLVKQNFLYETKVKGGKRYGETVAAYSDIKPGKSFGRKYFGDEVSRTDQRAYEQDSVFWVQVRGEPLSVQQQRYQLYQDSLQRVRQSETYLDSVDRVLNRITWSKMLIFGQIFNDHRKERSWVLPPITSLIQPISFGGTRLRFAGAYRKTFSDRTNLNLEADLSYGFRNQDLNGSFSMQRKYDPFRRGQFGVKAGRNFEFIYAGDAWVNVLKRSNIYLNSGVELNHERELFNGLTLMNQLEFAWRRSVADYKVSNNADSIFGIPNEPALGFQPYNAVYSEVKLYYTPKLRYIREPKEKIYLGSKYPTFYLHWRKGLPNLMNSAIDFDYVEVGLMQTIQWGTPGNTSYTIKTGDFLNTKNLKVIDYRFMRRGDPLFFLNPQRMFQALDSTFPLFDRYYQGNLLHEFNGSLINKIPFFKRLRLQEVAGGGFLIAPERDLRYAELFAGIERVFKWPFNPLARIKLGVYVVGSVANQFKNPVQFKIGLTSWDRFRNRWR